MRDIFPAAQRLVDEHGGEAPAEADIVAAISLMEGDVETARFWTKVAHVASALLDPQTSPRRA